VGYMQLNRGGGNSIDRISNMQRASWFPDRKARYDRHMSHLIIRHHKSFHPHLKFDDALATLHKTVSKGVCTLMYCTVNNKFSGDQSICNVSNKILGVQL
jgi:hypothetical protein